MTWLHEIWEATKAPSLYHIVMVLQTTSRGTILERKQRERERGRVVCRASRFGSLVALCYLHYRHTLHVIPLLHTHTHYIWVLFTPQTFKLNLSSHLKQAHWRMFYTSKITPTTTTATTDRETATADAPPTARLSTTCLSCAPMLRYALTGNKVIAVPKYSSSPGRAYNKHYWDMIFVIIMYLLSFKCI